MMAVAVSQPKYKILCRTTNKVLFSLIFVAQPGRLASYWFCLLAGTSESAKWSWCRSVKKLHFLSFSPAGGDSSGCKKISFCLRNGSNRSIRQSAHYENDHFKTTTRWWPKSKMAPAKCRNQNIYSFFYLVNKQQPAEWRFSVCSPP